MPRVHLVELEDLPWFPAPLRDAATDYLRHMVELTGQTRDLAPRVAEVLRTTGEARLVDLCSGAGGPLPAILEAVRQEGVDATAVVTDRYPNAEAMAKVTAESAGRITAETEPVDAAAVPARLTGLRTIFNAFHHLRPEAARSVLADAFHARQPIAVFELVGREPPILFGMLLQPILSLFILPFVKPRRWTTFVFTYLMPIMPLFIAWDGFVSCLRIYSPKELETLVEGLEAPDWTWEIGRFRLQGAPGHATYLVGRPGSPAVS